MKINKCTFQEKTKKKETEKKKKKKIDNDKLH